MSFDLPRPFHGAELPKNIFMDDFIAKPFELEQLIATVDLAFASVTMRWSSEVVLSWPVNRCG